MRCARTPRYQARAEQAAYAASIMAHDVTKMVLNNSKTNVATGTRSLEFTSRLQYSTAGKTKPAEHIEALTRYAQNSQYRRVKSVQHQATSPIVSSRWTERRQIGHLYIDGLCAT